MDIPPTFKRYTVNKSNEKAKEYQALGNKSFETKKWTESLIFYNKSLCFASSKNIQSLIYANRSAVYFEIQKYKECLENIDLAINNGFPKDKMSKLKVRKEKCHELMIQEDIDKIQLNEKSLEIFKLSYPASKHIPWIVDCVELKKTDKYGRGIYAKQDLKAGDIISIEDPVVCILRDDGYYKHCYNCMKTCMLNLIPCARTASIMFCSTECMEKTYSKFGEMKTMLMDDVKLRAEVVALFDGSDNFERFVSNKNLEKINKTTIFNYNLHNPKYKKYNKKIATCLLDLTLKDEKPINVDQSNILNSPMAVADRIFDLLFMHNINHTFDDNKTNYHSDSASIPLFYNLINHSCLPNAFPIFVDNQIVTCISEPIKAGDQIFVSYVNQADPMRDVMKKIMFSYYNFTCDCLECTDKYFTNLWNESTEIKINKNDSAVIDFLVDGWNFINDGNGTLDEIYKQEAQNMSIMQLLAYNLTFPC